MQWGSYTAFTGVNRHTEILFTIPFPHDVFTVQFQGTGDSPNNEAAFSSGWMQINSKNKQGFTVTITGVTFPILYWFAIGY